ncbi:hypothetical protein C8R45DRAFT_1130635 [Mycena sanguinolenta]|nr:hypothetical protein C8R45DRAFT_1130635 [Mycena sanguinolenta]
MLLILLAVHLLSQDSIAAPLPHPPDARATDSCDDINRSLFNIVWGCLATIFACTWVSVHPNVPPPDQNPLQLFWRRLKMMLIAIIAPEVMVGFAARQFFASRRLSKRESTIRLSDVISCSVEYKISKTHGFFVCMGGFVSPDGHPIATMKQLEDPDLGLDLQEATRNVNKEDIKDKSKGDALSKGVALLQGLWFILQCLARTHQHLAITQLEVATLAFAIINIFIWSLWWNKPLDVQQPIVVGPRRLSDSDSQAINPVQLLWDDQFLAAIVGFGVNDYHPGSSVSVPSFWSVYGRDMAEDVFLLIPVGIVFGAVHCAAWNAIFPTLTEMWIWRTSSLVIAAIPGFIWILIAMATALDSGQDDSGPVAVVLGVFTLLAIPFYIAARIILIVLPLAELRSLPVSAFVDVNWSTYIPHI